MYKRLSDIFYRKTSEAIVVWKLLPAVPVYATFLCHSADSEYGFAPMIVPSEDEIASHLEEEASQVPEVVLPRLNEILRRKSLLKAAPHLAPYAGLLWWWVGG